MQWWSRFERHGERSGERRVVLERSGDKAQFDAAAVDFIEIVTDPSVSDFFIVRTDCLTQLEAEWLVIQPEVFKADPTKGWEPVGGAGYNSQVFIGSEELSTIRVRPEDPATLCSVSGLGEAGIEVWNLSDGPLELVQVRPARGGSGH